MLRISLLTAMESYYVSVRERSNHSWVVQIPWLQRDLSLSVEDFYSIISYRKFLNVKKVLSICLSAEHYRQSLSFGPWSSYNKNKIIVRWRIHPPYRYISTCPVGSVRIKSWPERCCVTNIYVHVHDKPTVSVWTVLGETKAFCMAVTLPTTDLVGHTENSLISNTVEEFALFLFRLFNWKFGSFLCNE